MDEDNKVQGGPGRDMQVKYLGEAKDETVLMLMDFNYEKQIGKVVIDYWDIDKQYLVNGLESGEFKIAVSTTKTNKIGEEHARTITAFSIVSVPEPNKMDTEQLIEWVASMMGTSSEEGIQSIGDKYRNDPFIFNLMNLFKEFISRREEM